MNFFKKIRVVLLASIMLIATVFGVACKEKPTPTPQGYSVTFMVEGEQYGEVQTVQRGRRITKPADPTFTTEGYVFTGWFTDEAFAEDTLWNFTTGIVTSDMTLYAGYRVVAENVSDVKKAEEACTSKLVWTQSAVSDASAYEITLIGKSDTITLQGTVSFDAENFKVTFTPNEIPQGGKYTVSVKDTTKTAEAAVVENVLFGGAGTESNPYLIATALDFTMVNMANVEEGTYFQLAESITIETSREDQKAYVFNGSLLGKGKTITLENSNCGAIYSIGAAGSVINVGIAGKVSTTKYDSVGALADYNAGRVEKINTTANVESTVGLAGSNNLQNVFSGEEGSKGIAGGIVGTNLATGVIYNSKITTSSSSTGTVKASIAGGTIVGYNQGKVELCVSEGCFGAWNSKETGKSTSNYSYGGGIAGINGEGATIVKCAVKGSGKILAQRFAEETLVVAGANNSAIGGIAGYNMATAMISECYFSGIRVHGDENVGGITGINAGGISDCYVEGIQQSTNILTYIGGRTNIGGVAGKVEGTSAIENCYSTANVFAYGETGVAYALAETANNSVYITANPDSASLNDGTANPSPKAIIAPTGTGNAAIEVVGGSHDGQTTNVTVAESYLATVNGNMKFFFNETTVKLTFETEVLPEETMRVMLYNANENYETTTVAETGAPIDGPVVKGYKFVGWSLTDGGEVKFAAGAPISLYDLIDYADSTGTAHLYAVLEERVPNEGLIVAVWNYYVNGEKAGYEGASDALYAEYAAYMAQNGLSYNVEFRMYAETSVADFCAAVNKDGDIDVIIGAGNTVNAGNGIDYLLRADMIAEGLTNRKVVLLTDTDRAVEFYAWAAGLGDGVAEVTFNVAGVETKGTVDELWATKVTAPEVVPAEGYDFIGWALTENATEAIITKSSIAYADVKDCLTEGKVTLYPVFEQKAVEEEPVTTLKVSVWTKGGSWVTADELTAIKTGFEGYLAKQGYDVSTLTITYVETSTSKVADLGAEVNGAGDFDFIIGCGSNVTTGGGVEVIEKANIVTSYVAAGRMCAILTENELAEHFYAYLTTEVAAESYTLKVSVWTKGGDWVTADELTAIKAGFNDYLTANGYDVNNVTIEWVETTTSAVSDLGTEVNTAGDFDFIIGCGANVTTKGGIEVLEKADVVANYVAAGRMCARLTGNVIATLLYSYLTTAVEA